MRGSLFSDLVVSRPARAGAARWAAPMPVSMMLHGGALAALLLVPLMRATELPNAPVPPIAFPTAPPVVRVDPGGGGARSRPRPAVLRPPGRPFVAPAMMPTVVLPEPADIVTEVPVTGDVGSPCVGCVDPALPPGPGDGSGVGGDGSATGPPGPVRVGHSGVVAPRKLRHVDPRYPDHVQRAGIGATVVLECRIDAEGRVADIKVVESHPLFDAAAIHAVRQWAYTPSLLNGQPVSVLMTVTVRFVTKR